VNDIALGDSTSTQQGFAGALSTPRSEEEEIGVGDRRDPVVGVRLSPELIAKIDKHAKKQNVFRSDAIRSLLEVGLQAAKRDDAQSRKQQTGLR
jgi:hypothetical protein